MTQEQPDNSSQSLAEAYKQITEAEKKASSLEKMLDDLDAKMNLILQEAESIGKVEEKEDDKP